MDADIANCAYFPWLRLREPLEVDGIRLVPYRRGVKLFDEFAQGKIDELLSAYVDGADEPVREATIVLVDPRAPLLQLTEDEIERLYTLRELLSVSALSQRGYFDQGFTYCNSHLFQLVIQAMRGTSKAVGVRSRKRDGVVNAVWSAGTYKTRRPDHVHPPLRLDFDSGLLDALLRTRNAPDFERIYEAVLCFNLGNTDSPETGERLESILLCGAFERLLDCGHRADNFACAFAGTIAPSRPVNPRTAGKVAGRADSARTLREIWARDFYLTRSAYAHGKVSSGHKVIWTLREHLLLAAYVFPLALKSILAAMGYYRLTEDDQSQIDIFEELAAVDLFIPEGDPANPASWPWNGVQDIARGEMLERYLRDAMEAVEVRIDSKGKMD